MSAERFYQKSPVWLQTLMLNGYAIQIALHRYGPRYRAALKSLLESQHRSAEETGAYQDSRIRALIADAYQRSPYYRDLFDSNDLKPRDIRTREDLRRVPLLTKESLRANLNSILTEGGSRRGWLHGHTSGTTGSPLPLWYDRATCVWTNAVDARQKVWGGKAPDDWIGLFLGRVIVPTKQSSPPFWRANAIQRQVWFSSFHMDEHKLPVYVEEIQRRNLRFLEGYPSTLYILAKHVLESGQESLPMTAVFTSSETLHDVQREAIDRAFGCPIFDFYGLAERAIFAGECEAGQKHLSEEYGYTEVVDAAGNRVADGEVGYLVGTSLINQAMPTIRYRTGDVSSIISGKCECGRTLRRIRNVTTKAEDLVVTPEGALISPSILTHPFKPFPQITKSQIIQEALDTVRVKIVPSSDFTPDHQAKLTHHLRERLGPSIRVTVELVEEIPPEKSGKFRWVISKVEHDRRFEWTTTPSGRQQVELERE